MFEKTKEKNMRAKAYEDVISFCLLRMNQAEADGYKILSAQYEEIGNNVISSAENEGYKISHKNLHGKDYIIALKK